MAQTSSLKGDSWKEEIAMILLGIIGIVLIIKGTDAGLLAAVITGIATIAGVKLRRKD